MKSKLTLLFIAIVLVAISYFNYLVFKNHFFKSASKKSVTNNTSIQNNNTSIQNSGENEAEKIEKQNSNQENFETDGQDVKNTVAPDINVTPKDCDNDCKKFKKNNEKEYCQEICGTTTYFEDAEESGGSSDDCTDEKGVQKDYCLKDIAVGNKDFKTCEEIEDENIKKSCKNRITEDLLEEQQSSTVQ